MRGLRDYYSRGGQERTLVVEVPEETAARKVWSHELKEAVRQDRDKQGRECVGGRPAGEALETGQRGCHGRVGTERSGRVWIGGSRPTTQRAVERHYWYLLLGRSKAQLPVNVWRQGQTYGGNEETKCGGRGIADGVE